MKKYLIVSFLLIFESTIFSQNSFDSFLGKNGIFKTLVAKNIEPNKAISFDVKLTVLSAAMPSGKQNEIILYLNTTDGIVGVDKSADRSKKPNENNKELDFYIETMTKQSFRYTIVSNSKTTEKLETNLINTYNNVPFKKVDETIAKPKKYINNSIVAEPFFIDKMGLQKKFIRYCYGKDYPTSGKLISYLGSFGVGFYNIDGNTFLCVATEHKFMNMEITKIEKVNFIFNAANFKFKN